jgi:hypothetical protein
MSEHSWTTVTRKDKSEKSNSHRLCERNGLVVTNTFLKAEKKIVRLEGTRRSKSVPSGYKTRKATKPSRTLWRKLPLSAPGIKPRFLSYAARSSFVVLTAGCMSSTQAFLYPQCQPSRTGSTVWQCELNSAGSELTPVTGFVSNVMNSKIYRARNVLIT